MSEVVEKTESAGYQAAWEGAAFFDLSDVAKVELSGADARLFLNNLCTQDVKNLAEGAGAELFLTTAKAKVVAHGVVNHVRWADQPILWLDADAGQAQQILNHLNHFLISEQVELADRTNELAQFRLVGPQAERIVQTILASELPAPPAWHHRVVELDGRDVVVRRQGALTLPGFDLFCTQELSPRLHERLLAAGAVAGDAGDHEALRIEAGWPRAGTEFDENRFVVEVGRIAQAICYTKGCYLGQEPIVMARDRGHANRTLVGVRCGAGPVPAVGTRLFEGEIETGQVTSSTLSPRLGEAIALAYVRRGSQAPGTVLSIEAAGDRRAVVAALPFSAG